MHPHYHFDLDELKRLYIEDRLTTAKIAESYGCADTTVWRFLHKNGVITNPYDFLKGKPKTAAHKEALSRSHKTIVFTDEWKKNISIGVLKSIERGHSGCFQKGHKPNLSPERNAKIGDAQRGVKRPHCCGGNNPNWRGGTSFKYSRYLGNDVWDEIRWRILKRDKNTCQKCGAKGRRLDVHHKIPFRIGADDSDENLILLCVPCHRKEEAIIQRIYYRKVA